MNVTKSIDNSSNVTFSATTIHKIMMLKLIINWAKLKCVCMLCRLQYIPKSTLLNNNRKVFSKSEYASIEFRYHSSQTKILIFNFLYITHTKRTHTLYAHFICRHSVQYIGLLNNRISMIKIELSSYNLPVLVTLITLRRRRYGMFYVVSIW